MNSDFLLVHKSILPDYFPRIIEARDMIARENVSVTEACKACKISRSAFYKYKDLVYVPSGSVSKKAILSVKADDFPGVLSSLLKAISNHKANVLTISQDMPIHGVALITLMINFRNLNVSLDELIKEVSSLEHIRKAEVLAYE